MFAGATPRHDLRRRCLRLGSRYRRSPATAPSDSAPPAVQPVHRCASAPRPPPAATSQCSAPRLWCADITYNQGATESAPVAGPTAPSSAWRRWRTLESYDNALAFTGLRAAPNGCGPNLRSGSHSAHNGRAWCAVIAAPRHMGCGRPRHYSSFRPGRFPGRTLTRLRVTTITARSLIAFAWCSISSRMASTFSVTCMSTKRIMHGCGKRCTNTSSPKSLSSVMSTRCLVRQCKQRLISSLRIYLKGRKDIVSQVGQQRMQTAGRSTGVEQKSHRGLSDRDAIIHLLTDQ